MPVEIMYHVAPREYRDDIVQNGLMPHTPEGPNFPSGVYLFADQDNAEFFADHMEQMDRDAYGPDGCERDIWQVITSSFDLIDDPAITTDDEFQDEYPVQPLTAKYVTQSIGPVRLTLLSR